ncbi:membrane protein insertase YidC [Rhodococcus sp. Z13]|uniref:Membrane protein insertase YidC n=1 Tax=Rhodococcus sacchari TaxID=2962047 RepID=A0ACD4DJB4_9NOCA|nr:membrane protein insertase YidC [Rhodococcus sp. Z13]UYP20126.1 membrane protein insertase YidC [Rhodococcus sp. Z13]
MLDFVYYPVSAVLWFWHKIFGSVLGADSGFAWALSVMFLVFTLRLLLLRPAIGQVRTTRRMQRLRPQLDALKKHYGDDRQRLALETQKLRKEHDVNILGGCLPPLVQIPVFLGLYHVLRSFNRTGTGLGQLGMTAEENANTPNYVFSVADVQSFLDARLFGVPISVAIRTPETVLESFGAHGGVPTVGNIAAVAVPLMVIASLATHFNARAAAARQNPELASPATVVLHRISMWVFPLGALVFGPVLMIAVLLYWVSNNLWTYAQQHLVYARVEREEDERHRRREEHRAQQAPEHSEQQAGRHRAPEPEEHGAEQPEVHGAERPGDHGAERPGDHGAERPGRHRAEQPEE